MSFTFAGLVWAWWITDPLLAVLALIIAIGGRALWHQRQESIATRYEELEQEGSDEHSQAQDDGPALTDDHYPAAPALPAAVSAGTAQKCSSGGEIQPHEPDLPQPAADRKHSGPHYLAAVTQGETLQEEIDRLEARLAVLYDQLGKELAADVAAWDLVLASGAYARAEWLEQAA